MTSRPEDEDALAADAAGWVVRLARDDAGEADWLAFAAWLDAAPAQAPDQRRIAFDRAQAVWLDLGGLTAHAEAPTGLRRRRSPARRATAARRARVALAAASAAAVAAVVLIVGLAWRLTPPRPSATQEVAAATVFVTRPGQRRTLSLADGSRVEMDGGTTLQVASASGRQLDLDRGEAVFDVVHDPARPFTVFAGALQVRVLGTAFDVERDGGTETVAVARGAVQASAGDQTVRLATGQSARATPSGGLQVARTPVADIGSWRRDRRLYRDRPLTEVVADLNRRYPQPTRISDDGTGRTRFTGVLVLGPSRTDTLRRLTALLPLTARPGTDGAIVLSSASR